MSQEEYAMLCVITEPKIINEYKYTYADILEKHCKSKGVKYIEAPNLSAAYNMLAGSGGSVLLYAATEKWALSVINENLKYGLNLIVYGVVQLQYGSRFSSVCTDVSSQISELSAYLNYVGVKNISFFGVRPYIDSEITAAEAAAYYIPTVNHINADETLSKSYLYFSKNSSYPDAVICPNDLIAIYLINHLRRDNSGILKKMLIVSLQEKSLSAHYSKNITTFKNQDELTSETIAGLCKKRNGENIGTHLSFMPQLLIKEHSDYRAFGKTQYSAILNVLRITHPTFVTEVLPVYDEEYSNLLKLNFLLQNASEYELSIISAVARLNSYDEMAQYIRSNADSVKYYTSKLYKRAGFGSRRSLKAVLSEYFAPPIK